MNTFRRSVVLAEKFSVVSNATSCRSSVLRQNVQQTRGMFRMLVAITNKVDRDRIKEVGPDQSCAEWLLRCGASVRFKDNENWQRDFNAMVTGKVNRTRVIEEVEAVEAGIMELGFDHFDGCKHIRRVRFHHLPYFEDDTLRMFVDKVKSSLEHLELTSCGDLSDKGLVYLKELSLLQSLLLRDLPEVRNKQRSRDMLKVALPKCHIEYPDADAEIKK